MLSKKKKEQIKEQAITDLFNSGQLQNKLQGICVRHFIPLECGIQDDISQLVFELLCKYPTDKIVEMVQTNPARLLGLAVTMALRNGVYKDKRNPNGKWFNKSIAQQIMNQSTLTNFGQSIQPTITCYNDYDTKHEGKEFMLQLVADDDFERETKEQENIEMWNYVRTQLTPEENELLNLVLAPEQPKLKGQLKKDYQSLLVKLKPIITTYQNMN